MIKISLYVKFRAFFIDFGTIDRSWNLAVPLEGSALIRPGQTLLEFHGIRGVRLTVQTVKVTNETL